MLLFTPFLKHDRDATRSAMRQFFLFWSLSHLQKSFLTWGPMPQNQDFLAYIVYNLSSVDQALHTDIFGFSQLIDDVTW